MAEAVVSVLGKLAVVMANEANFLGGVGKKVERVQRELTRIKSCLIDADSKRKTNEGVQTWLNELRDVAYRIEDAIDTFFLKVGYKDASVLQKIVKVCKKPMKLYTLHNLGTELDNIQNLLQEIYEGRLRYGIEPQKDKSTGEAVKIPHRTATYSDVDENDVVGMQADKNKILELLRPEKRSRRAVITIVGAGGIGKTTLACMVYKSVRTEFDYHMMLSISKQFSLTDLLRKMVREFNTNFVLENKDVGDLVNDLKSLLISKRYLIILDDVWEDDVWNLLKDALPNENNGSRVLITTRFIEIAKTADSQMPPYELNFLDDRKSLDLLLKKSFPYKEPDEEYPINLLELAKKLSMKCKGLPLALVVLGGILLTKEPSYPVWERVLQTMNWHSAGGDCMRILAMSYEVMPYHLKACFQYLAIFPEDYVISAKCLIRMWIAEGFIPLEGKPTMEIMAEDCLEELSKRSMVQVLSRSVNGLIKSFKVHDILRDLAMHEAEHENFVMNFSRASNDTKPNRIIRRAVVQAEEKNSQFMKYLGPKIRSLLLFEPKYCERSLRCSNFRLLAVLEIVSGSLVQFELKSLDELIHLKYLRLIGCKIDLSSFSFHHMKSLETVDVRGSEGTGPCDDFWSIGTLMHVMGGRFGNFFAGPLPAIDLRNLQTLKWVKVDQKQACDWKLPNLRKLSIGFNGETYREEWDSVTLGICTNLLQTLPCLVSFGICTTRVLPMEIAYPKALLNYQNLQSLYLHGNWPKNGVEAILLPPNLVKLTLVSSRLKQNPMPELGKLNNLKKLSLRSSTYTENWESPIICPKGFPALQYLEMTDWAMKELTVAQGVMPKLTYLKVRLHLKVHLPPELQHVTVEINY